MKTHGTGTPDTGHLPASARAVVTLSVKVSTSRPHPPSRGSAPMGPSSKHRAEMSRWDADLPSATRPRASAPLGHRLTRSSGAWTLALLTHHGHDRTRPCLLTEMPGPRNAVLRRGGRTRCPPERVRTAAGRHLEGPSSPPHNPDLSSGSSRALFGSSPDLVRRRDRPAARGARSLPACSLPRETTQQNP
jgi:hypothetical protein